MALMAALLATYVFIASLFAPLVVAALVYLLVKMRAELRAAREVAPNEQRRLKKAIAVLRTKLDKAAEELKQRDARLQLKQDIIARREVRIKEQADAQRVLEATTLRQDRQLTVVRRQLHRLGAKLVSPITTSEDSPLPPYASQPSSPTTDATFSVALPSAIMDLSSAQSYRSYSLEELLAEDEADRKARKQAAKLEAKQQRSASPLKVRVKGVLGLGLSK